MDQRKVNAVWFLHMLTYFIEVVMPRLQRVEAIHQHAPYQEPKSSSGADEFNNPEAVEIVLTKEPGDDEPPPGSIEEITL